MNFAIMSEFLEALELWELERLGMAVLACKKRHLILDSKQCVGNPYQGMRDFLIFWPLLKDLEGELFRPLRKRL